MTEITENENGLMEILSEILKYLKKIHKQNDEISGELKAIRKGKK